MRKILAVLILVAAVALNASVAFAGGSAENHPSFFGDGFDNTTCADMPRQHGCL